MKKLFYIIVFSGAFAASFYVTKFIINKSTSEQIQNSEEQVASNDSNQVVPAPKPDPDPVPVEISNEELKSLILNGKYTKDSRIAENCMVEYVDANNRSQQKNLSFVCQQIINKKWRDIKVESSEVDGNMGKVCLVRIIPSIIEDRPDIPNHKHVNISKAEVKELILNGRYTSDKRIAKDYFIQYEDVNDDDYDGLQQNLARVKEFVENEIWTGFEVDSISFDNKSGKVNYFVIRALY